MDFRQITLEPLTEDNLAEARAIDRADVPEDFVDTVDELMELTRYGLEHGCAGRTFVARCGGNCAGVILLGEAIPWDTDPEEMRGRSFYRLMGFVIDRRLRGQGVGAYVLDEAVGGCMRNSAPGPSPWGAIGTTGAAPGSGSGRASGPPPPWRARISTISGNFEKSLYTTQNL